MRAVRSREQFLMKRLYVEWKVGKLPFEGIVQIDGPFEVVDGAAAIDSDGAAQLRHLLGPMYRAYRFTLTVDGKVYTDCILRGRRSAERIYVGRSV